MHYGLSNNSLNDFTNTLSQIKPRIKDIINNQQRNIDLEQQKLDLKNMSRQQTATTSGIAHRKMT